MSGNPSSPQGTRNDRIKAARKWLDRAEQQFADGMDILAVSTLMLAQAEMRLMVEAATETPKINELLPDPVPQTKPRPAISRNVITYGAMAACLIIGLVLGQFVYGSAPVSNNGNPVVGIQIADDNPVIEDPLVVEVPVVEPVVEEPPEVLIADADQTVEEVTVPVVIDEPPVISPGPVTRPRPNPVPETVSSPVIENPIADENTEPVATSEETPDSPLSNQADVVDIPSDREISAAEIALRTVQALSDRLFMEDFFRSDLP